MFPRPGADKTPVPKVSFVTKVGDLGCGVGYYKCSKPNDLPRATTAGSDLIRVIMFNPETNRSEDVSHAIAQEILRRLGLEGRDIPGELEDFIDRMSGRIAS